MVHGDSLQNPAGAYVGGRLFDRLYLQLHDGAYGSNSELLRCLDGDCIRLFVRGKRDRKNKKGSDGICLTITDAIEQAC